MRIGLLGGSFNPPHDAHRALSLIALKRLRLDRVWWLVTPGNPLKDTRALPPLGERLAAAARLAHDPRIVVSGLETVTGTRYTVDTIAALQARCPGVDFVWLMGADNLSTFHFWRDWRGIAARLPIAVIDRPSDSLSALASPAARALAPRRMPAEQASLLATRHPPAWVFLYGLKSPLSSTALRNKNSGTPVETMDRT